MAARFGANGGGLCLCGPWRRFFTSHYHGGGRLGLHGAGGGGKWRTVGQVSRRFLSDTAAKVGGGSEAVVMSSIRRKILGGWLAGCSIMVGGAVLVGGITRLTESGLSMTQWHLIKGMKPPRSEAEWEEEFERYKQFPEYKVVHQDLTLEGYKNIFYWEYLHRMWGRATGLAVLVPAAVFWAGGWLTPRLKKRAGAYSALVVLQGLYGWYMVKSGLSSRPSRIQPGTDEVPRVSQYRLAGHLSIALLLYSSMLYTALGLLSPPSSLAPAVGKVNRLRHVVHGATATIFLTCISGAFVAGLDAGLVYNSFPKMAGRWIPDDIGALSPKPVNITENPTTVQFNHRWLGTTTLAYIVGVWALAKGAPLPPRARLAANLLAIGAFAQVGLGITTLLTYVPTPLASSHQLGAVSLLSIAIWLMHELRKTLPKL